MAKKILIVDDEKDVLATVVYTLKRTGHEIFTATNGQQGFDVAKKEKPDLIVLDLVLPVFNGIKLGEMLKEDEDTKNIPVILMTASVENIEDKASKAMAKDYVLKPFTPKNLLEKITEHLG